MDIHIVAIRKNKVTLNLTKLHILDVHIRVNKVIMYEFHYDFIKNKYVNNSRLSFTDTDRLMYEIKTEDAYEDFSNDKEMFLLKCLFN